MFARSKFSRRFINVRKVLKIRAFKSSVKDWPLVATRASFSPCSVMNRMISRCRSCVALPSAVSLRISAQPASSESVKCNRHSRCSARAGGVSFLHPVAWHGIPIGGAERYLARLQPNYRKSSSLCLTDTKHAWAVLGSP